MTHPIDRRHRRARNQALIDALFERAGPNAAAEACKDHLQDFSPSLYQEIDWQRFRSDNKNPEQKQILDLILDLLFVVGFPRNLAVRDLGKGTIRLSPSETARLAPIHDAWTTGWVRPEGQIVLAEFDRFVESLRTAPRRAMEAGLREAAVEQIDDALSRLTDLANLAPVVGQILVNAHYAFLDLPWTRRPLRALLQAQTDPFALFSIFPSDPDLLREPEAMATFLRSRADAAAAPGVEEWVALLRAAADRIGAVDPTRLTGDDGDWTSSCSCCGNCAMWFATRTIAAMDDRMSFAERSGKEFIYLSPDLMVSRCPFCGFAAPDNVATFFFAEHRAQIIYLVPTNDAVSQATALTFWTPMIESLQKRYLHRRDAAAAEKFWAASELVTHDIVQFFYAIQMGETIAEDHVFNFIDLTDGSALIFDGEKRFARVVTPGEARMLRARYRVEDFTRADGQPGRTVSVEEANALVRDMAITNDAFVFETTRPTKDH